MLVDTCFSCKQVLLTAKAKEVARMVEVFDCCKTKVTHLNRTGIMAVDPGETTGVVVVDMPNFAVNYVDELVGAEALVSAIEKFCPKVIVCEDFRLRRDKALSLLGRRMDASEIIGAVTYAANSRNIKVVKQPAAVKITVHKTMLEHTGLWLATRGRPHARDAARHLVSYCWRTFPGVMSRVSYPTAKAGGLQKPGKQL